LEKTNSGKSINLKKRREGLEKGKGVQMDELNKILA